MRDTLGPSDFVPHMLCPLKPKVFALVFSVGTRRSVLYIRLTRLHVTYIRGLCISENLTIMFVKNSPAVVPPLFLYPVFDSSFRNRITSLQGNEGVPKGIQRGLNLPKEVIETTKKMPLCALSVPTLFLSRSLPFFSNRSGPLVARSRRLMAHRQMNIYIYIYIRVHTRTRTQPE